MSVIALAAALFGSAVILIWRVRETARPITTRKIVLPPLGMSTGLFMFAYPPARIPLPWAAMAFGLGALVLSYPLLKTSRLTFREGEVWLERSRAFLGMLLGLVAVRLLARHYVEQRVDVLQTGAIFFLLAFGMIVRWRVWMLLRFRALQRGA